MKCIDSLKFFRLRRSVHNNDNKPSKKALYSDAYDMYLARGFNFNTELAIKVSKEALADGLSEVTGEGAAVGEAVKTLKMRQTN